MKYIDYKNYDQWLFRYFEGELSPEEQKELFEFMDTDPALKVDFEAMGNSYVFEPEVTYPKMNELLVPLNAFNRNKVYYLLLALILLIGGSLLGSYWFLRGENTQDVAVKTNTGNRENIELNGNTGISEFSDNKNSGFDSNQYDVAGNQAGEQTKSDSRNVRSAETAYKHTKQNNALIEQNLSDKSQSGENVSEELKKEGLTDRDKDIELNGISQLPDDLQEIHTGNSSTNDDLRSRDIIQGKNTIVNPDEIEESPVTERSVTPERTASLLKMDPLFVKLTSSPVFIHPSFAGSMDKNRISLAYNNQMPSYPGNLITYYLSFDTYIHSLRSGVALISYYNNALEGTVNTWYNGLVVSPKIKIKDKLSIEPAMQLGYIAIQIDEKKIQQFDNTDPNFGYTYVGDEGALTNSHLIDLSGGILMQWNKFYSGFALEHITQTMKDPTDAAFIPKRYSAQLGVSLKRYRNSDFTCSPNIQFSKQYNATTLLWSSSFDYKSLIWGVGFGNQDRFVVMLGVQKANFRLGYNFDTQLSQLGSNAASAHEVSLRYLFNHKHKEDSDLTDDAVTLLR